MMTKKIKRRGIGKKSALLLSKLSEKNENIFTNKEAAFILHEKKSSVNKLLHDLSRNGWVFRISKGKYLIMPLEAGARPKFTEHELVIASLLISPYYISYWTALNYYGLTEQVSKTIFIATTKRKIEKKVKELNFKFITLNKNKFFGFKNIKINNKIISIAEKEKAIIDCLDFPRNCGGITEIIKSIYEAKEELDINKLIDYTKKMKNKAILNRLGYVLELLGINASIKPCNHYVILDPINKRKGSYNKKWKIIENITKETLLSWKGH